MYTQQNEDVLVEVEASCSQGQRDGQKKVKKIWRNSGEDCDNVWDLQQRANKAKRRNYLRNPRNWRDQAYNRCARDGIDAQVKRIEKECLEDDSSQCEDLGETAAEIIVFDNVCTPDFSSSSYGHHPPNYKKTCREVAYGICEGNISSTAREYCRDTRVSTSRLRSLQDKCEDQVNKMTGKSEGVEMKNE